MWVEPKNVDKYEVLNRLKMIFTSNKAWVVPAGKFARRWLVVDADEKYAGDEAYFQRLYDSMDQGGYGELMWLLENTKLPSGWHPRHVRPTAELAEQQDFSGNSFEQWIHAAIETEGLPSGSLESAIAQFQSTADLRDSYYKYCKAAQLRPIGPKLLDRAIPKIMGTRTRRMKGSTQTWGYDVPDAAGLEKALKAFMGRVL
jgi:hypothetical protein